MSTLSLSQRDDIEVLAREIFIQLAAAAGPYCWDWQPIAHKACEAAENFHQVFLTRYQPQTSTPMPTYPDPSQQEQSQEQEPQQQPQQPPPQPSTVAPETPVLPPQPQPQGEQPPPQP